MQWVWDHEGRRYLDFLAGIVTLSVGHCHPSVSVSITLISLLNIVIVIVSGQSNLTKGRITTAHGLFNRLHCSFKTFRLNCFKIKRFAHSYSLRHRSARQTRDTAHWLKRDATAVQPARVILLLEWKSSVLI